MQYKPPSSWKKEKRKKTGHGNVNRIQIFCYIFTVIHHAIHWLILFQLGGVCKQQWLWKAENYICVPYVDMGFCCRVFWVMASVELEASKSGTMQCTHLTCKSEWALSSRMGILNRGPRLVSSGWVSLLSGHKGPRKGHSHSLFRLMASNEYPCVGSMVEGTNKIDWFKGSAWLRDSQENFRLVEAWFLYIQVGICATGMQWNCHYETSIICLTTILIISLHHVVWWCPFGL